MARQTKIVDVRGALLFPLPFLMLGAGFVLAGLGVLVNHPVIGLILVAVGVLVVTAYEGTEIDPEKRTYREYNALFFLKKGKAKHFDTIEKIYINSGKVSERVYTAHTTSSSVFMNVEYNAYLKLSKGEKVFLFSSRNKNKLMRRAKIIAARLNTEFHDHSVVM